MRARKKNRPVKIGLVKFLNARVLDAFFRSEKGREKYEVLVDTPARLFAALRDGQLDAALISSVECLRNPGRFGYCKTVGVCALNEVKSILYIEKKSERNPNYPQKVLGDDGSRTSHTLLDILIQSTTGRRVQIAGEKPELIPEKISVDTAGLLIGDEALRFHERRDRENFYCRDLAEWWYETEKLPFVFALWAYPADRPVPDQIFEESLSYGEAHIEEIVRDCGFIGAKKYLTENLHFRLGPDDERSLQVFRERLAALDLL